MNLSKSVLSTLTCVLLVVAAAPANDRASEARLPAPAAIGNSPEPTAPVVFEANRGQHDPRVRFAAKAGGSAVFITDDAAVFAMGAEELGTGAAIYMRCVDGSAEATVCGEQRLPGVSNYLSRDSTTTSVHQYAGVRTRNVYDGIDLIFHSKSGALEYDFLVAPGASVSQIRLQLDGAQSVALRRSGQLVLDTAAGRMEVLAPVAYQEIAGTRRSVASRFVLLERNRVGFEVGAYDPSAPLTIDPVVVFASYLGGNSGAEIAWATSVDSVGNIYVVGETQSFNFPTTPGAFQSNQPDRDVFVTKFNPDGSGLVFSTYLGGSGYDVGSAIAVDGLGNVWVVGHTDSANFPLINGADTSLTGTTSDAFVARLLSSGGGISYSSFLGGSGIDHAEGVTVDSSGHGFVVGRTWSTDFPTTPSSLQPSYPGSVWSNAFVTKVNPTLSGASSLVYSTFLGGSENELAMDVAVNSDGEAFIVGSAADGFPTTANAFQPEKPGPGGNPSIFVSRLSPAGNSLLYSTYLGGDQSEQGVGLALEGTSVVYVTGQTQSSDYPTTPGAYQEIRRGDGTAMVVSKLDTSISGTASLIYSTLVGGTSLDEGMDIAVSADGQAVVCGLTQSPDFPLRDSLFADSGTGLDSFVLRLGSTGSHLIYSSRFPRYTYALAADESGTAIVVGETPYTEFPATPGAYQTTMRGTSDTTVLKLALTLDSVGLYNPANGVFYLRNSNSGGPAESQFAYGPGGLGWIALGGDWDGSASESVGLYAPSTGVFYLRNANTPGPADTQFAYGPGGLGWKPIVGDWDGDGDDTVGLYDPSTGIFYLRDRNSPGTADLQFGYGPGGADWTPIVGDWDGDGRDSIGLYEPATGVFYLRNENDGGPADLQFQFGPGGLAWKPIAADYDRDGVDSIGVYDPSTGIFYLRYSNQPGIADAQFGYGPGGLGWVPLVGDWNYK